jgi:hypothetical protein
MYCLLGEVGQRGSVESTDAANEVVARFGVIDV